MKTVNKYKYQLIWNSTTKEIKIFDTDIQTIYIPDICTHFEGTKDECDSKINELDLIMPE